MSEYAEICSATRDVFPRRGEEAAAEARLGRERDRVQHAVEPAADPLGERVEVLRIGDVELDDVGFGRQPARGALGQAHRPAERREHDLGAFFLRALGDGERDRRVVEHAGDEDSLLLRAASVRASDQSGVLEWRRGGLAIALRREHVERVAQHARGSSPGR